MDIVGTGTQVVQYPSGLFIMNGVMKYFAVSPMPLDHKVHTPLLVLVGASTEVENEWKCPGKFVQ